MTVVDACSAVPLFLTPKFKDQTLGSATGFLWRAGERHFLITNWHVVSGRNHETGKCTADHGGVPDQLAVSFPRKERSSDSIEVIVRTVDADGQPLWLEHPKDKEAVDIAALPIDPPSRDEADYYAMNEIPTIKLRQRIGMPLFILGFPFGRRGFGLPIWKQGSFASEPHLAPRFERCLVVDTASRPGMSGSPVIQRVHGLVQLEDGDPAPMANGDGGCRFVGIYSGRFHTTDATDAQLGRVWPGELIQEIVEQV